MSHNDLAVWLFLIPIMLAPAILLAVDAIARREASRRRPDEGRRMGPLSGD